MKVFEKRNIPNFLSGLRILLLPLYCYLFFCVGHAVSALVLILCALTDVLDGYLARKNHWITDFGKLLDPLADKLTTLCTLGALTAAGLFPWWLTALVVVKEIAMILIASLILKKRSIVVSSVWYGKASTVVFYAVVLALHFFELPQTWMLVLWILLAVSFLIAAIGYLFHYLKHLDQLASRVNDGPSAPLQTPAEEENEETSKP